MENSAGARLLSVSRCTVDVTECSHLMLTSQAFVWTHHGFPLLNVSVMIYYDAAFIWQLKG